MSSSRVKQHLDAGIAHYQQGRIAEAAEQFARALRVAPHNEVAHNCLGIVRKAQGRLDEAVSCYRRAVQLQPRYAAGWNNLGVALDQQQQWTEATACFEQAIRLSPGFFEAHNNLGNVLAKLERFDEAIQSFQQAIRLKPELAAAHNNLGLAYRRLGQLDSAQACFRRALQLHPRSCEAWNNLGNVLRASGQLGESMRCFAEAMQCNPQYTPVYLNLGHALCDAGRFHEAGEHYQLVLEREPDNAEACVGWGTILHHLDRTSEAIHAFHRATEIDPGLSRAWAHLAGSYRITGDLSRARATYEQLERASAYPGLARLATACLCPVVFRDRREIDHFAAHLMQTARDAAQETRRPTAAELLTYAIEPPFAVQFFHDEVRSLKETFSQVFAACFPPVEPRPITRRRWRVGIVVTRGHEGIFLKSMQGMLRQHDPAQFELLLFCAASGQQQFADALHGAAVELVPFCGSLPQVAATIQEADCDLLYYWEVGTDVLNYLLPHLRLAPVQCTGWGYQTTSGIANVDYYLSSELVETPQAQEHYSEQLILAPTLLTWQARRALPAQPRPRAAFGLDPDQHVYVCAQNAGKLHPDFDELLRGILAEDDRGLIVLMLDPQRQAERTLRERLRRHLGNAESRIRLLPRLQRDDYLSLLLAADVLLDPPHFNGANSTFDGLAMGKPIVTLPTRYRRGRFTAGCYRKMELAEYVANSPQEYIQQALRLAADSDYRHQVVSRIRRRSDCLFEDSAAMKHWQAIVMDLIQRRADEQHSSTRHRLAS